MGRRCLTLALFASFATPAPGHVGLVVRVDLSAVTDRSERQFVSTLVAASEDVLVSRLFHDNLRSLAADWPLLYASPAAGSVTPEELSSLLLLGMPHHWFVPTSLKLFGVEDFDDLDNYTAKVGPAGPAKDSPAGSMLLGRAHLLRYRQPHIVQRSCAINTVAHEISHMISAEPGRYVHAIEDTGLGRRPNPNEPLASYLVGAVAQCTWLQQRQRVSATGLRACVEVFGTHNFNGARCNFFDAGQPVEERPGLPARADPL